MAHKEYVILVEIQGDEGGCSQKYQRKAKCREKHMYKGPGAGNCLQALNVYKSFPGYRKIIYDDLI